LNCVTNNGKSLDPQENILFLLEIDLDKNETIKAFNNPNNDTGFIKYELAVNVT